jgi:hypothetical protein
MQFKQLFISVPVLLMLGGIFTADAADWLLLQGTEPTGSPERFDVWGFIQPQYSYTRGSEIAAGPFAGQDMLPNQIGPEFDSSNSFHLRRARLGVRGANLPLDPGINYFLLLEAGNNGITEFGDSAVAPTDASVTFNHIPHARIRIGQFKYPGAEEGLQAIHVFDYVNFSAPTHLLLLERFFDGDGSDTQDANFPNGSFGAFRDIGVQVFDSFETGAWEHSYAVMAGNGNGLNRQDNNDAKDLYLYWASERVFKGKGARREGWKLFAWNHNGRRTLDFVNGVAGERDFDRDRWGFGTTLRKGPYRVAAEYISADGMIFRGTDDGAVPGSRDNADTRTASFNMVPNGEATGYYVHLGYAPLPDWEFDLRYDYLDWLKNESAGESELTDWTLGVQYFFNRDTRALFNYEFRDAKAPNQPASAVANRNLDNLDDRATLQLITIF